MTAPHFHTTKEAKAAIERIEHNHGEAGEGAPKGIAGGSSSNLTTSTRGVIDKGEEKGRDWVGRRGIRESGK
jgi:hypothetical protein